MARLICDLSMSLDGYVAGPNQTLEQPLGRGGERLHEWAFRLKSFRERHGMPGGESGPDDDIVNEWLDANGAVVMGRRMFSGGKGSWEDYPNADGWWGDDPPFHVPVFVLTRRSRSSPKASRPHSDRRGRLPAARTFRSAAARSWCSST